MSKRRTFPNKYYVLKALKPDYLILIKDKKRKLGLTSVGIDRVLLNYVNNMVSCKYNTNRAYLYDKLNELQINFLIIDGIEEVFVHTYENNNYGSYLLDACFGNLLG